jgi:hypothetical protein
MKDYANSHAHPKRWAWHPVPPASPISVTEITGRILVECPPYPEQGFVAVAKVGQGDVVAIGASLWWNWIAAEGEDADNAVLLENLLNKRRPSR